MSYYVRFNGGDLEYIGTFAHNDQDAENLVELEAKARAVRVATVKLNDLTSEAEGAVHYQILKEISSGGAEAYIPKRQPETKVVEESDLASVPVDKEAQFITRPGTSISKILITATTVEVTPLEQELPVEALDFIEKNLSRDPIYGPGAVQNIPLIK